MEILALDSDVIAAGERLMADDKAVTKTALWERAVSGEARIGSSTCGGHMLRP